MKIGYARTSRDDQDIQSQVSMLVANGVNIEQVYVDAGVSGIVDPIKRPHYSAMIGYIESRNKLKDPEGHVTDVLVSEYSRLGRDTMSTFEEMFRLKALGVKVVPLSGIDVKIDQMPETFRPMMIAAAQVAASLEREHGRERTRYGLENARRKGKTLGRPTIIIDWNKIRETMDKYGVSENVARKICGYKASTFYNCKKRKLE